MRTAHGFQETKDKTALPLSLQAWDLGIKSRLSGFP